MNIANEIDFVAADEHRQVIPYIHVKDAQGRVTEYFAQDSKLTQRTNCAGGQTPYGLHRLPQPSGARYCRLNKLWTNRCLPGVWISR